MIDKNAHARVKSLLRRAGSSLTQVAKEESVTVGAISLVSQGHSRSKRLEKAISGRLGIKPNELWPKKYTTAEDDQ